MTILSEQRKDNPSRNTKQAAFTLKFAATAATALNPKQQLTNAFSELYSRLFAADSPPARILLQFFPPNFEAAFSIPLRPLEQNNPDAVAEELLRLNERYNAQLDLFNGTSEFKIYAVWPLGDANAAGTCLIFNFEIKFCIFLSSCSRSFHLINLI